MDLKLLFLSCVLAICLFATTCEAGHKKIVIHVPYKIKKMKHTHTVYKTIHHYHTHGGHKHEKVDGEEEDGHFEVSPNDHHNERERESDGTEDEEHIHHHHVHNEPSHAQHGHMESRLPVNSNSRRPYQNMVHHNGQNMKGHQSMHHAHQNHHRNVRIEHGQRRFLEDSRLHPEIENEPEQELDAEDDEDDNMKRKRSVKRAIVT